MVMSGTHAATSRTRSNSPRSAAASSSVRVVRRIASSWSRTRRGVKPLFTSLRRFMCSGSSESIMLGTAA